jgi:hypothetical protein
MHIGELENQPLLTISGSWSQPERMATRTHNLRLRPHTKTHKPGRGAGWIWGRRG